MGQTQAVRRIGLLGGTFDPIHYGHLVIAEEVRATLALSEVVFIPTGHPPHKPDRPVTPATHRLAMLRLAIASNPAFSICEIEIERPGPSYTVETLRLLRERWGPEAYFAFILGADSLADFASWYNAAGVLAQLNCLVAVGRPGYRPPEELLATLEKRLPSIRERLRVVNAPSLSISASDLRRRVAEGRPIKYQTPESVEAYIAEHRLYRELMSDEPAEGGSSYVQDAHAS
ncbi:nicotinate-nucleotide adenylyltransferase [Thermogemmatispora sp.]|uniref:nicotinate-nucleotide adenylyltransferase n=1 Tax=Thermogemmatispora sp. TaxID=1968838 RepID=UPI001E00259A|nr:nicotinate-nucleotide adenylyltransferase [Thermogemmatispora sp.]MBX5449296.1 nicotinate-nucleotide adenylyltransferase [Thermogemmatispora sp.]